MDKLKKRFIISSVAWTLLMMWLGPYGSFNPSEVGFYTSIMAGFMLYFLTYYPFKYLLKKQHK
jgi:hypothetical protein